MFQLIDRLKTKVFFKLVIIYSRYLIGFAFVFASFVKIKGERFTTIPTSEPVGYFFEAMYQTGFYWNFLGWCQFISGALLMSQRFSTIGAVIFFPVILNVFMITQSINFGMGTPIITTLMLLGTIFLLLCDYKKWMILFLPENKIKIDLTTVPVDKFMNDPTWTIAGVLFVSFTAALHLLGLAQWMVLWLGAMLTTGIAALVIVIVKNRLKVKSVQ